jgi:tRNA wybutosine-synthesizing protein 5
MKWTVLSDEEGWFVFHSCTALLMEVDSDTVLLWLFGGMDDHENLLPIRQTAISSKEGRPLNSLEAFYFLTHKSSSTTTMMMTTKTIHVYGYSMSICYHEKRRNILVSTGICSDYRNCLLLLDQEWKTDFRLKAIVRLPAAVRSRFLTVLHSLIEDGEEYLLLGGGVNCFSFGSHMNKLILRFYLVDREPVTIIHDVRSQEHSAHLNTMTNTMTTIPIYEKSIDDESLWKRVILERRKPCIFRHKVPYFDREAWTWDHLKTIFGDYQVSTHVCNSRWLQFTPRNYTFQVMKFSEFIDRLLLVHSEDKKMHYYLRSIGINPRKEVSDVWKAFPGLESMFTLPEVIESLLSARYFSSVLRISSADTQLWTHYDVMDNLLFQLHGRKRVTFFPPTDVGYLYMEGSSSKVIDIDYPDLKRFPLFSRARPISCFLEPGDILYIPALWFHNVLSLDEPSIAINYFWKHLDDDTLYDKKDLYGNKDFVPAAKALALVDELQIYLQQLPSVEIQLFYRTWICHRLQQIMEKDDHEER